MFRKILLLLLLVGFAFSQFNTCTNISSPGAYSLEADIAGNGTWSGACIYINASNVDLNCKGFKLSGNLVSTNTRGIMVTGVSNVSIYDCPDINGYGHGILLTSTENTSLRNITTYMAYSDGVRLSDSRYNNLTLITAHNTSANGFHLTSSVTNLFEDCVSYNNSFNGFFIEQSSHNNTFDNCTSFENTRSGFAESGIDYSTFNLCYAYDNDWRGFYSDTSRFGQYFNNTAYFNKQYGFYLDTSHLYVIVDNDAIENGVGNLYDGIYLADSENNTLTNNLAANNTRDGISLSNSDLNNLTSNIAHNNSREGIRLFDSDYLNVSHNIAFNNTQSGIYVDNSDFSFIYNNSCYYNVRYGFEIQSDTNNDLFLNNSAAYNTLSGWYMEGYSNNYTNNTAYWNGVHGFRMRGRDSNFFDNYAHNNTGNGFHFDPPASPDNLVVAGGSAGDNGWHGFQFPSDADNMNISNLEAFGNTWSGFAFNSAFVRGRGLTAYDNGFYGFHFASGAENNTINASSAYGNTGHNFYFENTATMNIVENSITAMKHLAYSTTQYLFQQPTAARSNNLTNFTIGYNMSIGLITFNFLNITDLYLNSTNLLLDESWVSLNDSEAKQANVSANITISGQDNYVVYRGEGFPQTRGEILAGSKYITTKTCAGTTCTFNVSGFSGYTLGDPGCLNLSDSSTWAGRIVNDSGTGILYVNQNTTLCRDHYYVPAPGFGQAALQMNASNIFLDCNESILDGSGGGNFGLQVSNVENDTIGNCTITNYDIGFSAGAGAANILFINNTAHNNTGTGFRLQAANRIYLVNDIAYNNTNGFVFMGASENSSLDGCSAYNNSFDGFYSIYSFNCLVTNSAFYENLNAGLHLDYSNYTNITNTKSYSNQFYGIQVSNSSNDLFDNVTLNGNQDGFLGELLSYSALTNSNIYDNSHDGFYVQYSANMNVTGSSAVNNTNYGFGFRYSNHSYAAHNYANGSLVAFGLTYSNHSSFVSNNATNSSAGFALFSSYLNVLNGSRAYSNTGHGIYLLNNADNNNFTTTTLSNNAGDGVYISSSNTNIFQGVTSSFNNNSFHLYQSDFNYMYNVTSVDESMHGFYLRAGSDYNRIIDGSATSELSAGIYMTNSQSNIVRNFISNGNSYGIWLETSVLYNTITNVSGTGNAWGAYLYQASSNTFTDLLFTGSAADGFSIVTGSSSNNFTNVVSHSNAGDGFQVSGSSNSNNFTNLVSYNNSVFGLYVDTTSYYNLFYDSIIYNQSNYLYVSTPAAENNFTNLTLGYTNAIGLVNYPFLNITYVNLNTDRFLLNADWVSLNDADAAAIQANKTANITISTTNCIYVLKRTGFPTTLAEILNFGTIDVAATATLDCSTPGVAFFEVAGFSGYAVNDYTACLNLSDPGTWAGRIVNDSGILYVNKNTTLCTDHYYMNVGTDPLLEMNASNIWLNCAFSIIDGVDDSGTGIYAYQKQNFTIANCTVQNYMEGIRVREAINAMIVDDTATSNSFWGIFLHDSNSSFVQYNNVSGNQANGIMLQNSHYNNIRYNNVSSNGAWRGIGLLSSSSYNNVSHNNVSGQTSYAGIEVDNSNSNLVSYNDIHSNYNGIYGANSDSNTFSRNEMHDNFASGLELSYSDYLAIENNTASGNSDSGLSLNYVSYSNISGNDAHGNGNHGILLGYSPSVSNLISGNNASGNGYHGIYLYFASGNSVINNEVSNSADDGINVQNSQDNIVSGNMVYGNLADGIQLYGDNSGPSRNNTLANNTLYGNDVCGIYLEQSHHNTLENNTAYGNYIGLFIYYSNNSVFSNSTIYGSDDQGIRFWESSGNNLTDTFTYSNGNWALMVMSNSINRFTNTLIYDQTPYMYIVSSSPTNFTNLTLGYNSTVGLVNYPSMNTTTNTMPYEGTNVHLQPDWVSITPSGLDIGQAASPAFITINNSACGTIGVLRETGFPTSLASILTNGLHYPTSVTCNGELATFYVDGFSGYTLGQEATTLDFNINESSPITYGTSINITCNASNTEVLVEIFQNGTSIAGPLAGYVDYAGVFAAGLYNFSCNTSGNENYTAAEASEPFQINKASPAVTFVSDLGWSIRPGQTVNISCNTSNPEITIELWNSTEMIGSGQYAEHVWTPPAGSYEYTCNSTETENYTAYSQANTLNVRRPSSGGDGRECSLQIFAPESASTSEEVRVGVMRMDGSTEGPMLYNARLVFTHIDSRPGSARPTSEYSTNTDGYSPGILFTLAGRWEIIAEFGDCEPATVIMNIYESDVYNIGLETSCDGNVITVTREVCEVLESPEPGMGEMGCRQVPVEGAEVRVYRCQEDWETAGDPLNTCSELVDTLTTDKAGKAVTYHRDMDVRIVADLRVASHFVGTTIFGTLQDSADCPVPEEIRINFDPACEGSTVTVTGTVCEQITIMQDFEPTTVTFEQCTEDNPLPGMRVEIYCCPDEFERTDRAIEDACTQLVDSGTTDSAGMFVTDARDCRAVISVERMLDTHMEDTRLMVDLPTTEECYECIADTDCAPGYVCRGHECISIEDIPPEQRECTGDGDCPSGYYCSGGYCAQRPIQECVLDQECGSGFICREGECVEEQVVEGEEGVIGQFLGLLGSIVDAVVKSFVFILMLAVLLLLLWFFFWKKRRKKEEEEEPEE